MKARFITVGKDTNLERRKNLEVLKWKCRFHYELMFLNIYKDINMGIVMGCGGGYVCVF